MAVNNVAHVNEVGLPLNAADWLLRHHYSKLQERRQMIYDLRLQPGISVVDAGCGPGLWTPLIAEAIGSDGTILGIDIDATSLVTAAANNKSLVNRYGSRIQYKQAALEQIPAGHGCVDVIFSANVSQYLEDPIATFAAMGPYLKRGGRLVVKDIDFGMLKLSGVDPQLQEGVFKARRLWEQVRCRRGYAYEDSWIGSKLASYLQAAGFCDIEERTYRIVRRSPLPADYRFYLQGIAEWFISEDAPFLPSEDVIQWSALFPSEGDSVMEHGNFSCEETEFVVSGVWQG